MGVPHEGVVASAPSETFGMAAAPEPAPGDWLDGLEANARSLLTGGSTDVWDALTRQFEARLIRTALAVTRGRRIEAAQKLGIGRNTITRKIQELELDA
jgi:two-component system, NtrC family, nitrogen regulation response regulator GlnG